MSYQNGVISQNQKISVINWCRQVLEKIHPKPKALDDHQKELSEKFRTNSKVTYTPEMTQCVYIRLNVPLYSSVIALIMTHEPELTCLLFRQKLLDPQKSTHIVSIGCGPGTDMIGILKYVISQHHLRSPANLRFLLCDLEPNWRGCIEKFDQVIRSTSHLYFQNSHLSFEKSFHQSDIRHPSFVFNLLTFPTFKNADLFVFSMLFSDIRKECGRRDVERVQQNVKQVFEHAKSGTYFLFLDCRTSVEHVQENIRTIFENGEDLHDDNCIKIREKSIKFQLPFHEDFKDLGEYLSLDPKCQPKFEESLTYFIYQKKKKRKKKKCES